jgi:hypothetical protein
MEQYELLLYLVQCLDKLKIPYLVKATRGL